MVACTVRKAGPDLVIVVITVIMVVPALAVAVCLFETQHDGGWLAYTGQSGSIPIRSKSTHHNGQPDWT